MWWRLLIHGAVLWMDQDQHVAGGGGGGGVGYFTGGRANHSIEHRDFNGRGESCRLCDKDIYLALKERIIR